MKQTLTLDEIYQPIENQLKAVPGAILDALSTPNELAHEVIRYFFSSQGKLLRPSLTLLGAAVKGVTPEIEKKLLYVASAFEIFHSATLIHDDIIDSAYLRRGIPAINIKWGAQTAVLVGDYLNDRALQVVFENGDRKILSIFLQAASVVCDGEIHELKEKDNFSLSENEYFEIIEKKTAALLAAAIETGGLMAGATPEEAEALKRYGRYFGAAFQIVDDCLDFTGNPEEFGKTLGADCAAGVLTLPLIRLLALVDDRKKSDVYKIFKSDLGTAKYQTLLAMVREYDTIEYSLAKAQDFAARARIELTIFPDSPARRSLERLVDYVIERNK